VNKLEEILAHKTEEVQGLRETCSIAYLESVTFIRRPPPPFARSLRTPSMALVAEVKRKSPSAGVLREPFEPCAIAQAYAKAGAQAISVLMDEEYFGGGLDVMANVRDEVALPLLYKEFVVDPWQIWQAASLGAAAVLLIVSALSDRELRAFAECCREARLEPLFEVHDEDEMRRAADVGATTIGVNNRDLKTFEVSLDTSLRLASQAPEGCTLISESGITRSQDVARLQEAGYHAVLVGEHLLRQKDIRSAVRELMADVWGRS